MKFNNCYKLLDCNNEDEVFTYFMSNLKSSLMTWDYFVDWHTVKKNKNEVEDALNLLNCLVGNEEFDTRFKELIKKHSFIISVLPSLIAIRQKDLSILIDNSGQQLIYEEYDFNSNNVTDIDIEKYLRFIKESGLKRVIQSKEITSIPDYYYGLEVGLGTNGRKNRGGTIMEKVTENFVSSVCQKKGYKYLVQADAKKVEKEFGITVPVDKSSRRYDFVIQKSNTVVIIETNFYSGAGSKLKSTAGEYKGLYNTLKDRFEFIWITDGLGWTTTAKPLRETFDNNDYILSLAMLEKGILEHLI